MDESMRHSSARPAASTRPLKPETWTEGWMDGNNGRRMRVREKQAATAGQRLKENFCGYSDAHMGRTRLPGEMEAGRRRTGRQAKPRCDPPRGPSFDPSAARCLGFARRKNPLLDPREVVKCSCRLYSTSGAITMRGTRKEAGCSPSRAPAA
ncbi:hypothetical protein VTK26DRAFT_6685 [Humicola hyalothermophila]